MTERVEQRYCIKFCQKLGDSQSETIRKIKQVFGDDAMGVTQIKEWFNRFKSGRASAESDPRSGRPQTARSAAVVERVQNLVMADRRSTVREIAQEVGVSKDSAHVILRDDLNMHRVAAKFVPRLLSPEQKDLRCQVAKDLLDIANTDPQFLNTVITGDESWVYGLLKVRTDAHWGVSHRTGCGSKPMNSQPSENMQVNARPRLHQSLRHLFKTKDPASKDHSMAQALGPYPESPLPPNHPIPVYSSEVSFLDIFTNHVAAQRRHTESQEKEGAEM
ncbi:protein GVQW3-like [Palaemon carinicauda]|uniref:protein GVQW3-like n=1 Tax=Palaemon carinicauda TaxID=392227 RepID=UPI0035B5953D